MTACLVIRVQFLARIIINLFSDCNWAYLAVHVMGTRQDLLKDKRVIK
jgi:hypothetical protein